MEMYKCFRPKDCHEMSVIQSTQFCLALPVLASSSIALLESHTMQPATHDIFSTPIFYSICLRAGAKRSLLMTVHFFAMKMNFGSIVFVVWFDQDASWQLIALFSQKMSKEFAINSLFFGMKMNFRLIVFVVQFDQDASWQLIKLCSNKMRNDPLKLTCLRIDHRVSLGSCLPNLHILFGTRMKRLFAVRFMVCPFFNMTADDNSRIERPNRTW